MRVGQFTLKTFFQYMENLARSNQSLLHTDANRHFVRSNFSELVGKAFEDLQSPAMLVDTYEAEGIDRTSDNLLVKRYVAFTIIKRITEKGNHAQLLDLETDCETIAMKVLARMKYDRRSATTNMRAKQQLFADVDLNAWEGHVLNEMLNGAWAAFRIQVPIINADDRLTMNAADWDDTKEQPIFYDISGLSCANLNDPSQGLTDEQRLNCLAVTVYESDGTTVNALVPAGGSYVLAPAIVCAGVDIVDQDNNVIAHVADGGTYTVTLADYLFDPLTPTTDVIVDPL